MPDLVQSVVRAFDILEALGRSEQGLGVTELARKLELKAPTTHNLLRTLVARGYAAKDRDGQRYRLGLACAPLGRAYAHRLRIPEAARPAIEDLARRLNESVIVAMMEQEEIVFVAKASGDRMLAVNFQRAWVKTGYGSVCGRVLLAHLSDHRLDSYMHSHPLGAGCVEDIRTRADLTRILARARRDGHLEYWRDDKTVLAMAAPIRDSSGDVVASIGLGMPGVRFRESERDSIVDAVKEAAAAISAELGYVASTSPSSIGKDG
jgi:IclR family transcriptional regulator, KDG regulon repressor